MSKNRKYTRTIRLSPSFGDWTKLSPITGISDSLEVTAVNAAGFDNLPKEYLDTALTVHYRLGELLCEKLSSDMAIKVELHTISVSQTTYKQFVDDSTSQIIQSDLVSRSGDRINVLLDWALAEQIVNRLTGGTGEIVNSDEFSVIETDILETQMQELSNLLSPTWKDPSLFNDLRCEFYAGKYQENLKVSPRESYVIFEYTLIIGLGSLHRMQWAYPNSLLRTMLSNYLLSTRNIQPTIALDEPGLQKAKIPAKVLLGSTELTMHDLRSLQPGDILTLDSTVNAPLKLILSNSAELTVQPVVKNQTICGQVIFWDATLDSTEPPSPTPTSPSGPLATFDEVNRLDFETPEDTTLPPSLYGEDPNNTEPSEHYSPLMTDEIDYFETEEHDHTSVEDDDVFTQEDIAPITDFEDEHAELSIGNDSHDEEDILSDFETDDGLFDDDDHFESSESDTTSASDDDDDFSWDDLEDEMKL
ncbi:hypothetical protein EB093_05740 [bacterium]|nr:hypothetical protein [bacterium]